MINLARNRIGVGFCVNEAMVGPTGTISDQVAEPSYIDTKLDLTGQTDLRTVLPSGLERFTG